MITVADAIQHALEKRQPMAPVTASDPDFDIARGYLAQADLTAMRQRKGAKIVGLKAGFTNTVIWDEYGIRAPILGPVFDTTLAGNSLSVAGFMEPKIEPEVVLRLCQTPNAAMSDAELATCVDAIAAGFEVVQSPFPRWHCKAADSIAAGAMHAALAIGPWYPTTGDWLTDFHVTLLHDDQEMDRGPSTSLLGSGPLAVLRSILSLPGAEHLTPGRFLSTGTVTRALPAKAGLWTARFDGLPLPDLTLHLT